MTPAAPPTTEAEPTPSPVPMPHRPTPRDRAAAPPLSPDARVAADGAARQERIRRAAGPRYGHGTGPRPAPAALAPASEPPGKSRIYSILSGLPVIMLATGLYFHYRGESAQSHGAPILAESVERQASFEGLSIVRSGGQGRHYLWFEDTEGEPHGARIRPGWRDSLGSLAPGDEIRLRLAPTVSGSSTLWVWRVEHDGAVLLDDSARLR